MAIYVFNIIKALHYNFYMHINIKSHIYTILYFITYNLDLIII